MKEGSVEYKYYKGNPSPLKGLVFWCRSAGCKLVLDYHGTQWRLSTYEDFRWYRKNDGLASFCPKHWKMVKALKKEQEQEDEAER